MNLCSKSPITPNFSRLEEQICPFQTLDLSQHDFYNTNYSPWHVLRLLSKDKWISILIFEKVQRTFQEATTSQPHVNTLTGQQWSKWCKLGFVFAHCNVPSTRTGPSTKCYTVNIWEPMQDAKCKNSGLQLVPTFWKKRVDPSFWTKVLVGPSRGNIFPILIIRWSSTWWLPATELYSKHCKDS